MTTQQITDLLDRHQVTYEHHPHLELRRIDLIASVTNQVRHEPIDPDTVDRYIAALADGATFPPILVRRIPPAKPKGKAQLVILGGNHRARAHIDYGAKTIDAYVLECDDLTALEIAFSDNATHGLPPTQAERLAHATTLIDRGRTVPEAARIVGIHEQRIYSHLQNQRTLERGARLGVTDDLQRMGSTATNRLGSLKDDRIFTKVARLATEHAWPQSVIAKLVGDLNTQPDVAHQQDYLQAFVAQQDTGPKGRKVGRPVQNPYLQLLQALGTIRGLNPSDTLEQVRTRRERQDLHDRLLAGARHLMAIDQLLQADDQTTRDLRAVR